MAAAVFTARGAAAPELVQTTAVGGRLPLSLFAPWEGERTPPAALAGLVTEGVSGCRSRFFRPSTSSPFQFLSLMKTLEERGFYSKQEGSMIIFPSW